MPYWQRSIFFCHYCDRELLAGQVTSDHVVPIGLGGLDILANIVPACSDCNGDKADSWPTCECEFCQESIKLHNIKSDSYGRLMISFG